MNDVPISKDSHRTSLPMLLQSVAQMRSATADWGPWLRNRGLLWASRLLRNKWHSLQEILHVEVPHSPLHVVDMEPTCFTIRDVKLDLLHLSAIWILLGATQRHVQSHNGLPGVIPVVARAFYSLTLGLGRGCSAATLLLLELHHWIVVFCGYGDA